MKKVVIDTELCLGCGACGAFCPEIFELDDETKKAKVIKQPKNIDDPNVQMAIESCPVEAIKVIEDETEAVNHS